MAIAEAGDAVIAVIVVLIVDQHFSGVDEAAPAVVALHAFGGVVDVLGRKRST